jgi:hypothetical protein
VRIAAVPNVDRLFARTIFERERVSQTLTFNTPSLTYVSLPLLAYRQ